MFSRMQVFDWCWDGGYDSAVGSPGGFGDVEICGYLMILYHHS